MRGEELDRALLLDVPGGMNEGESFSPAVFGERVLVLGELFDVNAGKQQTQPA